MCCDVDTVPAAPYIALRSRQGSPLGPRSRVVLKAGQAIAFHEHANDRNG